LLWIGRNVGGIFVPQFDPSLNRKVTIAEASKRAWSS
jgi:hypothetical protein